MTRYLEPTLRKDEFVAARGAKGIADLSDHLIVSVTLFRPTAEQHRSYPSHPSHTQIPNRHPITDRTPPLITTQSFIATIALSAAASPLGVALGGVAGHGVATGLAVFVGDILGDRIPERVSSY